jgi:hypothetical protein
MNDQPDQVDPATPEAAPAAARPIARKREDTSLGCREMAAADHVRADATDTEHMRLRMESSADAWTARADMLQRLERSHDARLAAAAAPGTAEDIAPNE